MDDLASEGLEELSVGIFIVDEMIGRPGLLQQAEILIFDDESEIWLISFSLPLHKNKPFHQHFKENYLKI